MELIELPGYTLEEKESIAKKYVLPKALKENGLKKSELKIDTPALRSLMTDYAREPGLRTLQQLLDRICRKAATKIVKSRHSKKPFSIQLKAEDLTEWLGPKRFHNEISERITAPGVVVGLAWTSMGGDILFIEATQTLGTGNLKLTGKMGDVMTESASIAWTYIKKKLVEEKKIDADFLKTHDLHLHIPAGAIPKDGPSAGVTMATTLYSLLTGIKSRQKVAMTGELSLIGKVLPVGGIKEKILAAKRAGIETVILPKLNEKDLAEVPDYALKGMKILFAEQVEQVMDWALDSPSNKSKQAVSPLKKKKLDIKQAQKKTRKPAGSRVFM